MSAHTADSQFTYQLPSLSYIDVTWEEPNMRAPVAAPAASRFGGLAAWLLRRMAGVIAWRRDRTALGELSSMSDYELTDIGLNRADLLRVLRPELNKDPRQRGKPG